VNEAVVVAVVVGGGTAQLSSHTAESGDRRAHLIAFLHQSLDGLKVDDCELRETLNVWAENPVLSDLE
jgi:hypothetical protein